MGPIRILSVVIPVFNERRTIEELLRRVLHVELTGVAKDIVIVDDGSTDGTTEWLRAFLNTQARTGTRSTSSHIEDIVISQNVKVLFHAQNHGKGAALVRGFHEVSGDMILVQDADLEYDPRDYADLIAPLCRDTADVVYGSRFLSRTTPAWTMAGYVGNKLVTAASNHMTGLSLTDVWTGYKVFKRSVIQQIVLKESGFELELELTSKVAYGGWRICEVPITYQPRSRADGKKITWKDGLKAMHCLFRYRRSKLLGQQSKVQKICNP
ncbi:MAG: glycosyl transferase [Nitrospirales bacterium]|nr:MAG: glycosyl transferase [Nitrospirales bacterium]